MQSLAFSKIPVFRLLLVACLTLTASGCSWVALVSVSSSGEQGTSASSLPSISADGRYVAFSSYSRNLVADDNTSQGEGVFVRDLLTGTTTQVNLRGFSGISASVGAGDVSISADGSCVAFRSSFPFYVGGDTNNLPDVFIHDRDIGRTFRVSVSSAGIEANGSSNNPSVSADCRYIAFDSLASTLVPGGSISNGIYIHDRDTGSTTRVSVDSAGAEGNGYSFEPSVSADGRYVAFASSSTNLITGDTNGFGDVFVHDRDTGSTTRVSVDSTGTVEGNEQSRRPSISATGRYVAFGTSADNLVAGDTNGRRDIFIHDRDTGSTTRVSVDSVGVEGNSSSQHASVSADGRYVAYDSAATNLITGDTNGRHDVFVHDRNTGITRRLSVDAAGAEGNLSSGDPAISADGRYVTFSSSTRLVPADVNGVTDDIFIRAVPNVSITSVVPDMLPIGSTTSVTVTGTDFLTGVIPKINGAELSNIVIVDENTVTMDVTIDSGATSGARNVIVMLYGTGPGVATGASDLCASCVTFF